EVVTLTLGEIEPVARAAIIGPRALHVASRGLFDKACTCGGESEVPDSIHVVVLSEHLGQCVAPACNDVDDAGRNVGGLEYGVQIGGTQWMALGGDGNDRVAQRHGWSDKRSEGEQWALVRAEESEHTHWLMCSKRHATQRRRVNCAVVLVSPGPIG